MGLNLYFGSDRFGAMAPPIPEALELYLAMMEGLDLKWAVGLFGSDKSIMDTPLARMALERGGSLRVGLEDYTTGPSNLDQLERRLVHTFLVGLVAIPIAVSLLRDDAALQVELRLLRLQNGESRRVDSRHLTGSHPQGPGGGGEHDRVRFDRTAGG